MPLVYSPRSLLKSCLSSPSVSLPTSFSSRVSLDFVLVPSDKEKHKRVHEKHDRGLLTMDHAMDEVLAAARKSLAEMGVPVDMVQ